MIPLMGIRIFWQRLKFIRKSLYGTFASNPIDVAACPPFFKMLISKSSQSKDQFNNNLSTLMHIPNKSITPDMFTKIEAKKIQISKSDFK